jgi:adenylate cyclase
MAKQTLAGHARDGAGPAPAEVRAALEQVLRSRCFEHAGRASDFLSYVVAKTLAGETERLKGYKIAVHVFGRPADFDAQSDPLVRVEALRLRQRLTEYYAGEGARDPVRLELPRGAYVVRATYTNHEPQRVDAAAPPSTRRRLVLALGGRTRMAAVAAAAVVVAAVTVALRLELPAVDQLPAIVAPDREHRTKIFVVPIENHGSGSRLDGLAAGLTEEIMLRLDGLDLYVIATQANWNRPGKAGDGGSSEHGYVFTGSVRDHAGGTRIALRITEAETGASIWSAAYDEPPGIESDPERQANVARDAAAAASLFGPVFDAELALSRRSAHALELPECQTRYRAFRRATDPALFPDAFTCYQSLVNRQPQLVDAWAGIAMLYIDEHVYYSGASDGGAALARARSAVNKALELDGTHILANAALTRFQYYAGDSEFLRTAERSLALHPDSPEMLGLFGILLTAYGDSTHGLELMARAQKLSPEPRPMYNLAQAFTDLQEDRPCEALEEARSLGANRWFIAHMIAAAAAGLCGETEEAAEARGRLLAVEPSFEAHAVDLVEIWRFDPRLRDAVLTGLEKAGLDLGE